MPEDALLGRKREAMALLRTLSRTPRGAVKTRVHGDLHLGQVLIAENDVVIVDFEGEPGRSSERRRMKDHPLRDVAGMLRSFAYAAETAYRSLEERFPEVAPNVADVAATWRYQCEAGFLSAYEEAAKHGKAWIKTRADRERLLTFHLLMRAFYEIVYEANNRPTWIDVPTRGALEILDAQAGK